MRQAGAHVLDKLALKIELDADQLHLEPIVAKSGVEEVFSVPDGGAGDFGFADDVSERDSKSLAMLRAERVLDILEIPDNLSRQETTSAGPFPTLFHVDQNCNQLWST